VEQKPFSRVKPAYFGFSSSNFTLHDHVLSTAGDALSGSITSLWPAKKPFLGCLLASTLVFAPCFFFSPFLGGFLFLLKFGRVSSFSDSSKTKKAQVTTNYQCFFKRGFLM